jgi:hypothetical protein
MITTIKVEKSTAKKLKIRKIEYMSSKKLGQLSNDKFINILLGKNTK